jgi:hypothetical protein
VTRLVVVLAAALAATASAAPTRRPSCLDAWNTTAPASARASVAGADLPVVRIARWTAQAAGSTAASHGCGYLFHSSASYLSISGEWDRARLKWGAPPTIHGRWSPMQQRATADNAVVRPDGSLVHADVPGEGAPRFVLAAASFVVRTIATATPTQARWFAEHGVVRVLLRGHFVDDTAPRPPGAPAPRGPFVSFTLDPTTDGIVSFSIGRHGPSTARPVPAHRFLPSLLAGGPQACLAYGLGATAGADGIVLTNRTPWPCVLAGRPNLALFSHGRRLRVGPTPGSPATGLTTVASHARALVRTRWSNWCGGRIAGAAVSFRLHGVGGRVPVHGVLEPPRCDDARRSSTLAVGSYEPR